MKTGFGRFFCGNYAGVIFISIFVLLLIAKLFDAAMIWVATNVLIQITRPYIEEHQIKKNNRPEINWLKDQNPGRELAVRNKTTNTPLGALKIKELLFLAKEFDKNAMQANNFYFDNNTVELFKRQYAGEEELVRKIEIFLENQSKIIIVWRK